jgi:branched-chain amino acid transport system permease protein
MTVVWAGLSVGAVYALAALTFNLGLAQAGVFNIAQAQLIVLSTFIAYAGVVTFGLPVVVVVLAGAVICGALAFVEERVAIRPLGADAEHGVLVTTVGFMSVLEGAVYLFWGSDPYALPFFGGNDAFDLAGGRLVPSDLVILGAAVVLAVVLQLVSTRTRWGLQGRASTEDGDAAALRGINIFRIRVGALVLAGALAGLLGVIIAPETGVVQGLGFRIVIYGFVALNVGGVGSYVGSLVGGLAVGLIDAFASRYFGADLPPIILLGVLLLILLVRPSGLLGRREARVM